MAGGRASRCSWEDSDEQGAEDCAPDLLGFVAGAEPLKPRYGRWHVAEAPQKGLHTSRRFGDRWMHYMEALPLLRGAA